MSLNLVLFLPSLIRRAGSPFPVNLIYRNLVTSIRPAVKPIHSAVKPIHSAVKPIHSAVKRRPVNILSSRSSPPQFTLLDFSSANNSNHVSSFTQLGLQPDIVNAIQHVIGSTFTQIPTNLRPTSIQSLAASSLLSPPPLIKGVRAIILAAETGSGKTLAYLGPILHILRTQESDYAKLYSDYTKSLTQSHQSILSFDSNSNFKLPSKPLPLRRQGYPRAIILVPSYELVRQILNIAKVLSHTARIRVVSATTSTPSHHIKRILSDPVDLFITTPGSLSAFVAKDYIKLSDLNVLVIDEADFIIDQGFAEDTELVINELNGVASTRPKFHPTVVFVSATIPKSLYNWIQSKFTSFSTPQLITTPALHRPVSKCSQQFVDVARQYQSNQHAALLDVLKRSHDFNGGSTLIFVNQRETVDKLYTYLTSQKLPNVLQLSKKQTPEERAAAWNKFCTTPGAIMVATDVAARGLDSTHVDLVINYNIPTSTLEYLHRIGRTARAGRTGRVISLVTKRSRDLVLGIQQRLKSKASFGMECI